MWEEEEEEEETAFGLFPFGGTHLFEVQYRMYYLLAVGSSDFSQLFLNVFPHRAVLNSQIFRRYITLAVSSVKSSFEWNRGRTDVLKSILVANKHFSSKFTLKKKWTSITKYQRHLAKLQFLKILLTG